MSSSPLSVYPHLPPTSNILNSQQRTRLVRSTRKLGAVLGTTPALLENDTSYTILPLEDQHLDSLSVASTSTSTTIASSSHRPSPSVPSISVLPYNGAPDLQRTPYPIVPPGLSSSRKCRLGDKPPKLYLRLDTVSISSTDTRFAPSLSPSACSAPPTPITPTVPDEAEIRRKRMAKLARHLGERIPAELVSTPEPNLKPYCDSSRPY
ncbi:hypothetical protein JVU11DRAFT_9405 [Chiua virens]|nr:hypothetical protein JVU11DRAFT_9405 [Chiua virens]